MAVQASTGMRFFASGVELVRKTFDDLGQSGQKMWAGIAAGQTKASPGMKAINEASKEVQGGLRNVASNAGAVGNVLAAMGPGGVAAAAGIGGVVLALHEAIKSMDDFGKIGEVAKKIGVSTDALQKWRYVVEQTGGSMEDADTALAAFSEKFGGAMAGNQRNLRYFEALGFSQDSLKGLKDVSTALPAVTARIASLKSENEQLFIAQKLGIESLLPAIKEGQGEIDNMMRQAQEMGLIVSRSTIEQAKKSNDEFKRSSEIIGTELKKAFIDLSPIVLNVAVMFADIARWLGRIYDQTKKLKDQTSEGVKSELQKVSQSSADLVKKYGVLELVKPVGPPTGGGYDAFNQRAIPAQYSEIDQARLQYQENMDKAHALRAELARREAADASVPPKSGTDSLGDLGADRKGSEDERYSAAIKRAREQYLSALERQVHSIDEELQLALQGLADEKQQRDAELKRQVKDKQLTQAQSDQIAVEEQRARDAKAAQLREHALLEKRRAAEQYDDDMATMAIELLRIQGDMEVTAEGRYAAQKSLLDAERAQARKALQYKLDNDPNLTPEQKKQELDRFDSVTKAQKDQLDDQQSGLRQAFHDAFRNGIHDALSTGNPFAMLEGFFSTLADHFVNKVTDRLSDQLFNLIDGVLSDIGKDSSGGGGFFQSLASGIGDIFGTGHAAGGPTRAGVMYPVAEKGFEIFRGSSDGYVLNHDDSVASIAAQVSKMIEPSVTVATAAPTVQLNNYGEPVVVDKTSYDSGTNTLNLDLRRGLRQEIANSVSDGALDSALGGRYGAKATVKRRG